MTSSNSVLQLSMVFNRLTAVGTKNSQTNVTTPHFIDCTQLKHDFDQYLQNPQKPVILYYVHNSFIHPHTHFHLKSLKKKHEVFVLSNEIIDSDMDGLHFVNLSKKENLEAMAKLSKNCKLMFTESPFVFCFFDPSFMPKCKILYIHHFSSFTRYAFLRNIKHLVHSFHVFNETEADVLQKEAKIPKEKIAMTAYCVQSIDFAEKTQKKHSMVCYDEDTTDLVHWYNHLGTRKGVNDNNSVVNITDLLPEDDNEDDDKQEENPTPQIPLTVFQHFVDKNAKTDSKVQLAEKSHFDFLRQLQVSTHFIVLELDRLSHFNIHLALLSGCKVILPSYYKKTKFTAQQKQKLYFVEDINSLTNTYDRTNNDL